MDGERLKNVGIAVGIAAAAKIAADKVGDAVGNKLLGAGAVALGGLFLLKGDKGTYVVIGAGMEVVEDLFRKVV